MLQVACRLLRPASAGDPVVRRLPSVVHHISLAPWRARFSNLTSSSMQLTSTAAPALNQRQLVSQQQKTEGMDHLAGPPLMQPCKSTHMTRGATSRLALKGVADAICNCACL